MAGTRAGRTAAYLTAALVLLLDQLSKAWAVQQLSGHCPLPFVPGLLRLQLTFNTGAAFSLLSGNSRLLGAVSLLVAVALVIWIQSGSPLRRWQALGVGLLLGGAIGNGLDRWRLGTVVDFLEFVPFQFPIFNLADAAINLAVAALAIDVLARAGHGDR